MKPFSLKRSRSGFTLVELLVALAIIIILSTLALLVIPSTSANNAVGHGADQVSAWLVGARNRALRDKAGRGVHLLVDSSTGYVTGMELVEQPEPFRPVDGTGGICYLVIPPGTAMNGYKTNQVVIQNNTNNDDAIRRDDLLRINFSGTDAQVYRITNIQNNTPAGSTTITVAPDSDEVPRFNNNQMITTRNYTFLRRWRPLSGETPFQFPKGTLIDLSSSYSLLTGSDLANDTTGGPVILFSKAGPIQDNNGGKIILGVRRPDEGNPANNDGEPILIVIYTRTGSVAQHPWDPTDHFRFARDGKGSGL
jgi:prepilin-type N-terminal cleavage/methylation domain-containing protein